MEHVDVSKLSDGYHTFEALYAHRRALTAALCHVYSEHAWKSMAHHPDDDEIYSGYFIVGVDTPHGTITYHYEMRHWDDFPRVATLKHALKWDGASPDDTVDRLLKWAHQMH